MYVLEYTPTNTDNQFQSSSKIRNKTLINNVTYRRRVHFVLGFNKSGCAMVLRIGHEQSMTMYYSGVENTNIIIKWILTLNQYRESHVNISSRKYDIPHK